MTDTPFYISFCYNPSISDRNIKNCSCAQASIIARTIKLLEKIIVSDSCKYIIIALDYGAAIILITK